MREYRATKRWPYHISSGGAVYREQDGRREYALLYRGGGFKKGANAWHLPKGTLSRDETLETCALREIREESGIDVAVEGYLGILHGSWIDPTKGFPVDKTTHYFLTRCLGEYETPMDDEHERVDWLAPEEAMARLRDNPKREHQILQRAEDLLRIMRDEVRDKEAR